MADNPETESVPTTDEQAVAVVSRMMEPLEEKPTGDQETESQPANQEEPVEEAPAEEAGVETSDAETEDVEPDEESVELPDTIDGLAEELGVSPEDLAEHLKIAVTVNGEKKEVTLSEARMGQQRDQDYRQKTMELADQRKALEAESSQALERWQQSVQRLDETIDTFNVLLAEPSREEMNRLLETDPVQYQRVKAQLDERREILEKAKGEQRKLREDAVREAQANQTKYRAEQQSLLAEKFPDVRDPEKLQKFERAAADYLKVMGYSDEEVTRAFTFFDHRNILMLGDAMKYRAMENGKGELTKKVKRIPKVQKPGTTSKRDTDKLTASKDRLLRLKKSGNRRQQTDAAVDFVQNRL